MAHPYTAGRSKSDNNSSPVAQNSSPVQDLTSNKYRRKTATNRTEGLKDLCSVEDTKNGI